MKKVAIVTIYDLNNCGNRLQNYALQNFIEKYNFSVVTLKNDIDLNQALEGKSKIKNIYRFLKKYIKTCMNIITKNQRLLNYIEFDKKIKKTKKYYFGGKKSKRNLYDYYVVGSDQVWNPTIYRMTDFELLKFVDSENKISYAASFGVSNIDEESRRKLNNELQKFKAISVREEVGKEIIKCGIATESVEVLVDPTMLLTAEEWDVVSKKPVMLNSNKYILNYFLGEISKDRKKEIEKIATENNCDVINILDTNSPFYNCGPGEFLYLEKNAFLVCTDSFHSSVFSIIYDTPFVVFERQDKFDSMNSRIDTLLSKFKLEYRKFNGNISNDLLKCDYSEAKEILEREKEKSREYLCKALDADIK